MIGEQGVMTLTGERREHVLPVLRGLCRATHSGKKPDAAPVKLSRLQCEVLYSFLSSYLTALDVNDALERERAAREAL